MPAAPTLRSTKVSHQTRLTAVIVASALFMQNLDSTIIATALPTMARSFGYDPVRMNVALTSYLLSLTVFIPASGWVADRYGTRNVFRAAILVFTIGSILCGVSNGLPELVASRVLQGLGGAMMVPVGRLLLLRTAAKSELVAAMAWLTMPALLGPVVGPPIGGFIVTYFNWRWTFFINIPVGMLGMLAVTLFIQDFREPPRGKFDLRGLILTGAALVCGMFGFRDTLIWNGVLSGIMLMLCALFRPAWPAAAIYLVLLVGGFLRSLQFTAYNTLAYGDVPRPQMSAATSLYTAGQQLAATIGVTVGALSLEIARTMSHHTTPENSDFSVAFVVVGLMTLIAAPIAYFMPISAGDDLTGRHAPEPKTPEPTTSGAAPRAGE